MRRALIYIIWAAFGLACSRTESHNKVSSLFSEGLHLGLLDSDYIDEASGLESSINNPGLLWTHNDSGGMPCVYLISEAGALEGTFFLKCGWNRDWEDISLGPGPEEGKNYLFIAETGDNKAQHEQIFIYRMEEPTPAKGNIVKNFDRLTFQYPDGKRDAECLMVDPVTRNLYIISKREENVGVYMAPFPHSAEKVTMLKKLGTLPFTNIVAGDISADGKEVILKTYDEILYWKRSETSVSIDSLLREPPMFLPYESEPQGESIAWSADGRGFFTLSEEPGDTEAGVIWYQRN